MDLVFDTAVTSRLESWQIILYVCLVACSVVLTYVLRNNYIEEFEFATVEEDQPEKAEAHLAKFVIVHG